MGQAAEAGARVLRVPELCLTGYTCGDPVFAGHPDRRRARRPCSVSPRQPGSLPLVTLVGPPLAVAGKLYNCAVELQPGAGAGLCAQEPICPTTTSSMRSGIFAPAPSQNQRVDFAGEFVPFRLSAAVRLPPTAGFLPGAEVCEDLGACNPLGGPCAGRRDHPANLSASDETIGKGGPTAAAWFPPSRPNCYAPISMPTRGRASPPATWSSPAIA